MMDIGREYIGIKQSHGSHQTEYRRNHSVPDLHVRDITPSLILHHREKKYFSRSRIFRICIWRFDVGYCNGESQGKPDSENNFHFSLKLSHFSRGRLGISLWISEVAVVFVLKNSFLFEKRKIILCPYIWKFCRMVAKHNGLSWVLFPREPPK